MNTKMRKYCELRAVGVTPQNAVLGAGYTPNNADVRAAQLEARADVRETIAEIQSGGPADAAPERETFLKPKYANPLELFLHLMNNPAAPDSLRLQAAKDAMPYCHGKIGEGGKKEKEKENAERAAGGAGRFGPRRGPGRPRTTVN